MSQKHLSIKVAHLLCPFKYHAELHIDGSILLPPFLEMAKTWPFHGLHMVFQIGSSWTMTIAPRMFHAKFHIAGIIMEPSFLEMTKIWPFMAKTWSSHGPSD